MLRDSIARMQISERIRAALSRNASRRDALPYGLVFDVDPGTGVTIRPAARPVLADLGLTPRYDVARPVRTPAKSRGMP